jgi:hypothetical protein
MTSQDLGLDLTAIAIPAGPSQTYAPPCGCGASEKSSQKRGGASDKRRSKKSGRSALAALEGLSATTDECAEDVARAPGGACASPRVLQAVELFVAAAGADAAPPPPPASPLPQSPDAAAAAVRAAAAALDCGSESCVITHPAFLEFVVEKKILPEVAIERDLATRFKAEGPRESTQLLNNFNIDETLRRWARVFPEFHPCPFAMMDFDRTREPFATVDLVAVLEGRAAADLGPGLGVVRRPARCFGCVVNTDVSSGPGKHWVAVFVDCRDARAWSVEYFNSAGNPPPKAMVGWMERQRARLADYAGAAANVVAVPVTDMDHQESQTECGLYALFYIRRRLEGTPYQFFFEHRVADEAMTAFRTYVFRAS